MEKEQSTEPDGRPLIYYRFRRAAVSEKASGG
jgi:hypothetical protein